MELDREQWIGLLKTMLTIRNFELRLAELFAAGKVPGFVHLYAGQEAVAAGVCANLRRDDYIASTHRGHGHCIAKGGDLRQMMAELYGRATGYCKGKGGSMHIADLDIGILGANGIVGGGLVIAPGAGLSAKLRKTDQVTVCFFGDGASNQSTFHEGINLASVWNLPVIFVCENNLYGISTHQSRHQKIRDVSDRAQAYGIPGVTLDGNDVIAVYQAAQEAVRRARAGEGPTLLECKTYRQRGHFEGDPMVYRPREEMEEWRRRDPIERFWGKLREMRLLEEADYQEMDRQIRAQIEEAIRYAEESPVPEPAAMREDVYA
ncbi:MAG: thiamine pyrophosphate-dependent dehydrogenase E1 component subunit alpha [Candidatus Tectomicrobia bacterium]|uniref:Thiamine pyrophosphate-dependent dehydrogenase E1 component subunit alpha n=1 Tax=Tectimicrobiota bacterium TaxID=2528274 RepID=A0A932CPV2_UNCTE|nr:thiamine pyrophosphate-dependent dehydrogenase E1 component subunit alpha [Candidatus Tectomicrobia bacterium]